MQVQEDLKVIYQNEMQSISRVDKNFPQLKATLREIGVPPLQILTLEANGAYHFIELTGDEQFIHYLLKNTQLEEISFIQISLSTRTII